MLNEQWLVVDDDAVLGATLQRALQREVKTVHVAINAQEAVTALANFPIQRSLVDLKLGDECGLIVMHQMLQQAPDLQVVVMTGYASVNTAVEAIKSGAMNYLVKPVSVYEVLQAFEEQPLESDAVQSTPPMSPKRLEWEHIQRVLADCDGNISQAARLLNMHRRTLQRKLAKKPVRD